MTKREIVIVAIAILAVTSAVWSWYHPKTEQVAGPVQWREVTKDVIHTIPVTISNCTVQALPDNSGVKPQELQKEPVIAEGNVPASTGGFELKTTVSKTTGEASMWALPVKRSLFGFEDSKEIGVRYNGLQGGMFGRWTFVRVGSFYGALYGEGATDRHIFAGAEVSYRW